MGRTARIPCAEEADAGVRILLKPHGSHRTGAAAIRVPGSVGHGGAGVVAGADRDARPTRPWCSGAPGRQHFSSNFQVKFQKFWTGFPEALWWVLRGGPGFRRVSPWIRCSDGMRRGLP
ncbi:hypothetical protein GCM10009549_35510 [Streptomyces thermoalcalitolerans]|uniref:Uncharacterized protein n=1 Tax=Streptomyces thermoalcalitolerans TaxID=65605 RepID=A0ABN1NW10_9ACTN